MKKDSKILVSEFYFSYITIKERRKYIECCLIEQQGTSPQTYKGFSLQPLKPPVAPFRV